MKTDDLIQKEVEKFKVRYGHMLKNFRVSETGKGDMNALKNAEQFLTSSLHKIKDEAKREAIEKVDDYFEGLVVMPFPQESRKVLINSLKEDGGEGK